MTGPPLVTSSVDPSYDGNARDITPHESATPATETTGSTLEALSPLTLRDRKVAVSILQVIQQEQRASILDEAEQIRELQVMLMLNYKAEIQAVDNLGDITHWLDMRLTE
jgi:meiotic recombination protein SPO11